MYKMWNPQITNFFKNVCAVFIYYMHTLHTAHQVAAFSAFSPSILLSIS